MKWIIVATCLLYGCDENGIDELYKVSCSKNDELVYVDYREVWNGGRAGYLNKHTAHFISKQGGAEVTCLWELVEKKAG